MSLGASFCLRFRRIWSELAAKQPPPAVMPMADSLPQVDTDWLLTEAAVFAGPPLDSLLQVAPSIDPDEGDARE
eukprot:2182750-Alexandrium_andersonii.AAC.1